MFQRIAKPFRISIHALLAESDCLLPTKKRENGLFLSTLSLRRATFDTLSALAPEEFLSTLSLRRATAIDVFLAVWAVISIHALLAESDLAYPDMIICTNVISIHALLAESDSQSSGAGIAE